MEASGLRWLADRASGAAQAESSITGSTGFERAADIVPVLRQHGDGAAIADLVAFRTSLTGPMPDHVAPPPGVPFALSAGVTAPAGR